MTSQSLISLRHGNRSPRPFIHPSISSRIYIHIQKGSLPPLRPHLLNLRNSMSKRKLEQLPPPLHPQILPHLPPPHMELLPPLRLQNLVLHTRSIQRPHRRLKIIPLLRLNVHLTAQTRTELQFHPADRLPVVVCFGGGADVAGQRRGGVWVVCGGGSLLAAEIEIVEDGFEIPVVCGVAWWCGESGGLAEWSCGRGLGERRGGCGLSSWASLVALGVAGSVV